MQQQLLTYLEPMDIPEDKKNLNDTDNLWWIYRYLWAQRTKGLYDNVIPAMEITRLLISSAG